MAAIPGKALCIKGGCPIGQVVKPGNIAPELNGFQAAGQFGKIIVVNPRAYGRVTDSGDLLGAVFKQIAPAIGLPGLTETVGALQTGVVHPVFPARDMILMTDVTRIKAALGPGIALRRNHRLGVGDADQSRPGRAGRQHCALSGLLGSLGHWVRWVLTQ